MLRIRLRRMGRRNQPFFQIVVIEKGAAPKGGRAKEILGSFDPLTKQRIIKKERVKYWLSVGAQPSDTVYNMLISEAVIQGKKKPVHAKSKKKKETAGKTAASAAAPKVETASIETPSVEVETLTEAETSGEEEKQEAAPEAEEAPKGEEKE